jgi:hypothetical protein
MRTPKVASPPAAAPWEWVDAVARGFNNRVMVDSMGPDQAPATRGPDDGATDSSNKNQDLVIGYATDVGEHRRHETKPKPRPHDCNGRCGDRPLAVR